MTTDTVETPVATTGSALLTKVSALLAEAGHVNPTAWEQSVRSQLNVEQSDPAIVRFLINTHWDLQLGLHGAKSGNPAAVYNARYCLEDKCSEEAWEDLWKRMVAPCIAANNL